jgi:ABC-type uncharacterized transport system auxiliary subunit
VKCTKPACLLLTCLLPVGCGLLSPPKAEPTLAVLAEMPDDLLHERAHNFTMLVVPPEASPAYDTTRMAYTVRAYEIGYFRDNEWAETPAQMLNELLVRTVRELGYFKAVLTRRPTPTQATGCRRPSLNCCRTTRSSRQYCALRFVFSCLVHQVNRSPSAT